MTAGDERTGIEQELKYQLRDARHAARYAALRRIGSLAAIGRPRRLQVEDRYIDTADRRLADAGYAVRIRSVGGRSILTVKSASRTGAPVAGAAEAGAAAAEAGAAAAGAVVGAAAAGAAAAGAALHRREELEAPGGPSLDPHAWPASAARAVVIEHVREAPLEEIVAIRQVRRVRNLGDGAGAVELSVDEVDVVRAGHVLGHFLELEVELKSGPPDVLAAVMAILAGDDGLVPVTASKLERGLALAQAAGAAKRSKRVRGADAPATDDAAPATPGDSGAATSGPGPATSSSSAPTAGSEEAPGAAGAGGPTKVRGAAKAARRAANASAAAQAALSAGASAPPASSGASETPPDAAATGAFEAAARLVVGKTPGVTADDLLAEAGRKVLRFHFARMLAREAGTRSGEEIEDLHGMRVATRRMRAAWRVYGDAFRLGRTKRLRDRLREVAGRLGAVRDLDVLIDGLREYARGLPAGHEHGLDPLIDSWTIDREAARIVLLRTLDAGWYGRFIEEYRAFVTTEGAGVRSPASPVTPHHVRDAAGSRIWLAYEQVRGYEPVLRWAPVETLHELRIAAKWLRYTIEFFREALGPEVDATIAKVVALQDHLGLLHDADVSIALTRQFLVARSSSLTLAQSEAISDYLQGRERELERLRRTVGVPWRGVAGLPYRRMLARSVSAL